MDISVKALEEAVSIRRQIDNLERRLSSILGGAPARPAATAPTARQAARYFSPSTRAKLAAAARARWARLKGGAKPAPTRKKGALTAAGRRKLSELMKARWAARRKSGGTKASGERSSFSEERWTHSCRPKKALAVDEGSLGSATESFGAQVIEQYKRKRRVADSFRFQIRLAGETKGLLARGLEPPRVSPYGPEPYASANSATRAKPVVLTMRACQPPARSNRTTIEGKKLGSHAERFFRARTSNW